MFVTIEGLDGSGKSTVVDALVERYPNSVVTKEPSDREYGQLVRRNLSREETEPLLDFYLFMVDRVDHIQNLVRPAAEHGHLVISDRYADSTRAYQPVALANSDLFDTQEKAARFIEQTMTPWNYEPDVTIYLDISVDTAVDRSEGDEKYEKREFLREVHSNYRDIVESEPERFIVIDGEQPKEQVAKQALSRVDLPPLDRI